MEQEKVWWQSKVILVNIIMAVAMVLLQFPALAGAGEFLKTHFAEAGMAWAFINMILRAFKSNITL